jgi:5-methyltetrahydropteroyltriglutamate--homocysteine methyltransferase
MSRHTGFQDLSDSEFLAQAELHVAVLNEALANVPRDRVRMHLCWGNYAGPHDADIPVESIIDTVLKVEAQAIAFEAANPRHEHEWTVWGQKCAYTDTILMPGMLDTTSNTIEHPELVAQRIVRFAETVGKERVIASTDCGFGTFVGSVVVDPDVAYEKLRSLVEGAKRATEKLY